MELWWHGALVSWCHFIMMLWYLGTMVPWCHVVIMQCCLDAMLPWCHDAMMPWYHVSIHVVLMSWCPWPYWPHVPTRGCSLHMGLHNRGGQCQLWTVAQVGVARPGCPRWAGFHRILFVRQQKSVVIICPRNCIHECFFQIATKIP